jgi:outer membrane protein assembly factor BamB
MNSAIRMTFVFCLFSATAGSLSAQLPAKEDWVPAKEVWATWRGGNERHGSTTVHTEPQQIPAWLFRSAAPLKPAWSTASGREIEKQLLENRIRYDSAIHPIVAQGKVYFGSSVDHQLQCRDLISGAPIWSLSADAAIRLAPTYAQGKIYFGADDGCAYCVDATDGKLVWKLRAGPDDTRLIARGEMISLWPVRTGVLVEDGLAYFGAGIFPHERIYVYCVDALTGEVRWVQDHLSELDAGRTGISPQGYLLTTHDQLFVPSGRSLPVALDKKTGQLIHSRTHSWRSNAGGVVGGYRALLADGQLVASGDHHWLAMDERTGDTGFAWYEGKEFIVQGDFAFSTTGTELLKMQRMEYAINSRLRQELRLKYRELSRAPIISSVEAKQQLSEQLKEIEARLQEIADVGVLWRVPCDGRSSLLATANLVFVGGQGYVAAFSNESGQEVWRQAVEGEATGLVAAEGSVLVSTDQGEILAFHSVSSSDSTIPDSSSSTVASSPAAPPSSDPESKQMEASPSAPDVYSAAADQILRALGRDRGFCLVLDNQEGRLAEELAKRSQLTIYAVGSSADAVQRSRQRLLDAGLYGHRVTVHHLDSKKLPYSNYFADLIVSETQVATGDLPEFSSLARHLKPAGGKVILLMTPSAQELDRPESQDRLAAQRWLESLQLHDESHISQSANMLVLERGALPGAGSWTHLYGTPANTAIGNETRVKSELGVLWYGDPGPGDMVNRHEGAVGPLAAGGRLFVQGENSISAYDAYNGTFLWRYENEEAIRTGVFQNQNPGNLAITEDRLFHFVRHECYELDAASGEVLRIHLLPPEKSDGNYQWGYLAVSEGMLLGTATLRAEIEERQRRRGRVTEDATDQLFAIELSSGLHAWQYQGTSISHHTLAVGPGRVYFVDSSLTSQQREELLAQDKSQLALLTGAERELAEERAKRADIRRTVALDLFSGKELWAQPVDVTDCSDIGIGGGRLTLMYHDGTLLLGGANANGHYWKQFVSGEFTKRRLVALSADHGYQRWAKDANYKGRPIIVGNQALAEPWSFNLMTGEQLTREHPTTGQKVPWSLMRTGHHCGILTGCESGLLMFRSGDTAFYDLEMDAGANHFSGHRLGCWINAIPACGLVLIPEASAGCVCQFSIAATIVLEPREQQHRWTIHSAVGSVTPVEAMRLNLGAPGDRRDSSGNLWLSYPRRNAYKETSLSLDLDLQAILAEGGDYQSVSETAPAVRNTTQPWMTASWVERPLQLTFPLLGPDDEAAQYRVELHVSGTSSDRSASVQQNTDQQQGADLAVNVIANGQKVVTDHRVTMLGSDTCHLSSIVLESISVEDSLTLDFVVQGGDLRLHGAEIVRLK